jgi:Flp pilus assembly protein protease CpaA
MMLPLIFPILLWLTFRDIKSHRIPNNGLLLLFSISLAYAVTQEHPWHQHLVATGFVLFASGFAYTFLGLGMGDIKFLIILTLLVIPTGIARYYCFLGYFSLAALFHVIVSTRYDLTRNISIPLAPSLSIATVMVLFL